MAIANLHETLLSYYWRKSQLNLEISELQSYKHLSVLSRADFSEIKAQDEQEVRDYYKALFENGDYDGKYKDYTEIPDFCDEMDKIAAEYQAQIEEISAYESRMDTQITVNNTELEETNAYIDWLKTMLSSNIKNDFSMD